jgi:probable rRNA maturation factor
MSELILRNRQRVRRVDLAQLRAIAEFLLNDRLGTRPYEITVFLVASREMAALNEKHLGHTGSTDVITFGYTDPQGSEPLIGDIFICIDDAVQQAREFRSSWPSELVRYFVHAVLHLQGFDDLDPAARRRMKREEDRLFRRVVNRFRPAGIHALVN